MFKKIIVPVDMGQIEKGEKILAKARTLLDAGGEIVLVNVAETVPGYLTIELPYDLVGKAVEDAKAKLAQLAARNGADAKTEVRVGSPAREILAAADEHHADLILIASHRPDYTNYLIGSTADRVVRHARCSVLVDR